MNLILLDSNAIHGNDSVVLDGRQSEHVIDVLHAKCGDSLKVGIIGGGTGHANILEISNNHVIISAPHIDTLPPRPWFDLILAAPRPKVLHRLWAPIASLGVRNIFIVNAAKVEKCYFGSHWLTPTSFTPLLIEGLEQACTTAIPTVSVASRFKPFIQDVVARDFSASPKFVAHPGTGIAPPKFSCNPAPGTPLPMIAIGPEGGWIPFELQLLEEAGFQCISLGPRTLRTGVAIIAAAASLAAP